MNAWGLAKYTMEDLLCMETLSRSFGPHNAVEPVGGVCHGNVNRNETTRIHAISCLKTIWSSLTDNGVFTRIWLDICTRAKSNLSSKTHVAFDRAQAKKNVDLTRWEWP